MKSSVGLNGPRTYYIEPLRQHQIISTTVQTCFDVLDSVDTQQKLAMNLSLALLPYRHLVGVYHRLRNTDIFFPVFQFK